MRRKQEAQPALLDRVVILEHEGNTAEILPVQEVDAERGRERLSETTMSMIGALVIALGQQEDAAHALTEILALRDQQWPEL
ncbi:MAG: hypothetical protein K6T31_07745, partial [Alicyclobacillus sp.]|nr:hypothetical protein [Alicyclobacillus sp.]